MIDNYCLLQALLYFAVASSSVTAWLVKSKLAITTLSNYDVYEFGEEISFNCTGPNAELIRIQVNNNDIPSNMTTVLGSKVLSSTVPIVRQYFDPEDNTINCFEDTGIPATISIRVDYALVHDVNDITCKIYRSKNLMKCNWSIGKYCFPEYMNVTFSVRSFGSNKWVSCSPDINETQHCTFRDDEHFHTTSFYTYLKLQIKNTKRNVSKTFERNALTQSMLVKPVMVKKVKVLNVTSRAALIKWSLPIEVDTLLVRLNVSSELGKESTIEKEELSRFQLEQLKPFTTYWISIDSRLKGGQYYSDPVIRTFTSDSDVPEKAPGMYPGSFYITNDICAVQTTRKTRNVTVFWKSIPQGHRNGRIVKYVLTVMESAGGGFQNEIDGNQTSSGVILECDLTYDIKVKASTAAGCSNYSAVLKVPRHKDIIPIKKLVIQVPDDKSFVNISWEQNDKIDNYAVLWCRKSPDFSQCNGEIHYHMVLKNGTRQLILRSDVTGPITLLRFGVTGVSGPSAHYSSGITWETCRYRLDQAPEIPDGLDVAAESPSKSLAIMWSAPKCDWQSGYVHKYRIRYCLLKDNNPPVCKEDEFFPRQVAEYKLQGLTAFKNYSLQLQAVSPLGKESPFTSMVYGVPYSDELTDDTILSIILAIVGFVILCMVLIALWLKYNIRRRPYECVLPVISSNISNHVDNKDLQIEYYKTGILLGPESSGYLQMLDGRNQIVQTMKHKTRLVSDDSGTGSITSDSDRKGCSIGPVNEGNPNSDNSFEKLSEDDNRDASELSTDYLKPMPDPASLLDEKGYLLQNKISEISAHVHNFEVEAIGENSGDDHLTANSMEGDGKKSGMQTSTELPTGYVRTTLHHASLLNENGYLSQEKLCQISPKFDHVSETAFDETDSDDIIATENIEGDGKKSSKMTSTELSIDYVRTTLHLVPLINENGYISHDNTSKISQNVDHVSGTAFDETHTDDIIATENIEENELVPSILRGGMINGQYSEEFEYVKLDNM